ncbi:MAG: flagellar hook-length control protein FliK [Myxococcales bacterium]|nr:flagellar hook-length control protein FliK [Myxococcales bacterium]
MPPIAITLPMERLELRGLGMDAGGPSATGHDSAPKTDDARTHLWATHVVAGHVLGLTVTPEPTAQAPSVVRPSDSRSAVTSNEAAPAAAQPETVAPRPEPRVMGPSMAPSELDSARGSELRSTSADAVSREAPSVAPSPRDTAGAAAVLERLEAVASARQELGQNVSARPTPPEPTVQALPAGLGGGLGAGAERGSERSSGSREGSADRNDSDRDERARPAESHRGASTDGFVAPAHDSGVHETSRGTPDRSPEPSTTDGTTGRERVAEVVEHLEVRSVEAGRNPAPLKVNLGELGEVRVSMNREDGLSVRLDASDPRAAAALETGRRELEVALEAHGLRELRVTADGGAARATSERLPAERLHVEGPSTESHGRTDDRDGTSGQDRSGRHGSEGRESGTQQEREHREAMNAAFERRERERRFFPRQGPVVAERPLGSA